MINHIVTLDSNGDRCGDACNADSDGYYDHHRTREGLLASTKAGCYICSSVWAREGETLASKPRAKEFACSVYALITNLCMISTAYQAYHYSLKAERGRSAGVLKAIKGRVGLIIKDREVEPNTDTGSPSSWRTAERWFAKCMSNHKECSKLRTRRWTPTRLLDLGADNTDQPPRLCLAHECRPGKLYMTLSHCWGNVIPSRLLQSNMDAMRNRINLIDLPKTFRDAIVVAKKFRIQYLWIDR